MIKLLEGMENDEGLALGRLRVILACFGLSTLYIASLYVWRSPFHRDHPSTIKKRFFSTFVMLFISPLFLYFFSQEHILQKSSIWQLLGLRWDGLLQATIVPLLLTMILFLGPLAIQVYVGLWKIYTEPAFWRANFSDLIWLRNHVVAPLSEEFTFRACMVPLLMQGFRPVTAVYVCPLFFGIAHFHHMVERIQTGMEFHKALIVSCFQFAYTTLFGAYSAYLFAKTGHMIAPFVVHAFCNYMGFPDFSQIFIFKYPQRWIITFLFIVGLISWVLLLTPLTNPMWYGNKIFWIEHTSLRASPITS